MATIDQTHIGDAEGVCNICGGKSSTFWVGEKTIEVCHKCAVQTLPLLIADAIPYVTNEHIRGARLRIISTYWQGIALRAEREIEKLSRMAEQN